ncbi:hypothetical protein [Burkholderia sp. Nafp2/4-1b]|uniref:hypothetical protein n=1 Tax=Burkholderia sp. Nafp2/4-1b TaxID=2116686 RepID=UPI0013CECA7C|nr:hypothetical protein [Burkholderia sp. Nafp2/4-1b]
MKFAGLDSTAIQAGARPVNGPAVIRIRRFSRFAENPSAISIRRIRTRGDIPAGENRIPPISNVFA